SFPLDNDNKSNSWINKKEDDNNVVDPNLKSKSNFQTSIISHTTHKPQDETVQKVDSISHTPGLNLINVLNKEPISDFSTQSNDLSNNVVKKSIQFHHNPNSKS